ncbi:metallophosphoesterase family protein [Labedella endophytica]|uniref:Phosphoesterase n=1 Tax=Labedella endophytica TaxID=1523160 RepID=A0A433JPC5_9MICO|nr:metallophosphoesterase [Labedella endophytica]RUQ97638.1 metallophosphoesterase [Labedella endophytica]
MSTSILLLADTHLPKRAKTLPHPVLAAIDTADVVVHAGDWVDAATLDLLEARSSRFIGVYGNNDHGELRERLPEVASAEIEGVRVAVIHETGASIGREKRMDAAFPHTDLLVFGHSHIPWDTTTPAGLRLLNPGSPTDRRRQPYATFMRVTLDAGAVSSVELARIMRT